MSAASLFPKPVMLGGSDYHIRFYLEEIPPHGMFHEASCPCLVAVVLFNCIGRIDVEL